MQARDHVLDFLEEIRPLNLHGFEIRQSGQQIAAGSAAPFDNSRPHRMYSVSKSVVSLAIGVLVSDGKLRLTDSILPFFLDYAPENVPDEIRRLTIRDLLRMATCYDVTSYNPITDTNWTRRFFEDTPSHAGGTIFTYDTGASQVLGSLVERLTGMSLLSFVKARLFGPIGLKGPARWLCDATGNPQGGTGLIMPLSDLALLAEYCLSDGKGLMDTAYLRAATSFQIPTDSQSVPEERNGYGYYFWQMRKGFCMYGLGGQMGLCLPEADLVLATTGDLILSGTSVQPIYDAFFRHLAPMRADHSLMEDPEIVERIREMRVQPVSGRHPRRERDIRLLTPIHPIEALSIGRDLLTIQTADEIYTIPCEPDTWTEGMFKPIGPCYASAAMIAPAEYRAHIELTGDTTCAIHVLVSFRDDGAATVRVQSSTWECVPGYSGTGQGTWTWAE